MRKGLKNFLCIIAAATLACGAAGLSACGSSFVPPEGGPSAEAAVESNGGFVVQKGEYIYFINGVETYTSDNTYGDPVKGALMRIKKADVESGKNTAETVIPSLMVASDYSAGIFIYGDRIYYATPDNRRNTSGEVENTYLDFKSAKLDGSDIKDYFYVADNSTKYRYVEAGEGENKTVYLMYAGTVDRANSSGLSALLSYNTATEKTTELAVNYREFAFSSADKTDPWIYYTMPVPNEANSQNGENTLQFDYQQIYRVRADWTAESAPGAFDASAPYKYEWTDKFLEATDGEAPYTNLGELVLDGRGTYADPSQYNHSETEPENNPGGYTYTLRSYTNGGVYFVRNGGEDGALYYLAQSKLTAEWDSVAGNFNNSLAIVANATDVSNKATTSALYFIEEGTHHYLYINSSELRNVTVNADGTTEELAIAFDVSGATLKWIDATSDTSAEHYKYVYFTKSNGSGMSVERAVYSGNVNNYKNLSFDGDDNKAYKSVKVLDIQHASGWYDYEVLDGMVYYADAATVGSVSYNYIACVNLNNAAGGLKNNAEIAEMNEKYEEIMGTKGLVQTLSSESNGKLSALISYYFKAGSTAAFDENLAEAKENGRSETYLFTEAEQTAFKAFVSPEGEETTDLFSKDDYKDADGKYYRTYSYFATEIGKKTEADEEAIAIAWRNSIQRDSVAETEEETGLADWEIALIVIACVIAVGGCAAVTYFLLRKRNQNPVAPKPERMAVDTTDDRDVDVYAAPIEEPLETPAEEPAETTAEEPAEQPAEEPAEEPAETPAEEPAEIPTDTPNE